MKKLLAVLLASALFVPAIAGGLFNNVETYGEIQTIGTLSKGFVNGNNRDVSNRLIFGMGMDLVEDVKANVTFLSSSYWGTYRPTYMYAPENHDTLSDYLNYIVVAEAYVTLGNVFNALDVKVGRQFYGDENSAIIYFGPTHYKGRINTTRCRPNYGCGPVNDSPSIDAAVLSYNNDMLALNVVYSKLRERNVNWNYNPTNGGDLDTSLLGFDAKYTMNDNLFLQAYLYDFRYGVMDTVGTILPSIYHLGIYGAKVGYTDDAIKAGLEYARNYEGGYFEYNDGWMVKADASMGVKMDNMDLTPRIGYVHSEQGFFSYGNYAPGIYFGGATNNVFANGNARIMNVGVDFKFASLSKFNFALDYYCYKNGPAAVSNWLGNEFNLMAKYGLNEYVELHTGLAYVTSLRGAEDTAYAAQMGMIVKF